MSQIQIVSVTPLEKGKREILLGNGITFSLYSGECRKYGIKEDGYLEEEAYQKIITEVLTPRAKKRAMHLLEKMDRTKKQLFDKLSQNGYPKECIESAIAYVESYHYIDDLRYAKNFIRYQQEKKSRMRLQMDLCKRGVPKERIEQALEEEYENEDKQKIYQLLLKRKYDGKSQDANEFRKQYQFCMRRGYKSADVLFVMKNMEEMDSSK